MEQAKNSFPTDTGEDQAIISVDTGEPSEEQTETPRLAEQEGRERRQFARRAARWACVITTRDKTVVHCKTRDVSERGASIATTVDFNKNAVIVLEIRVIHKELRKAFRVLGEVKHSSIAKDGFTIGIFFKDAAETTFEFFQKYANNLI